MQTGKTRRFPVVLMGSRYWQGLLDWIRRTMLGKGMISAADLKLFHLTDDPEDAVEYIVKFHETAILPVGERRKHPLPAERGRS